MHSLSTNNGYGKSDERRRPSGRPDTLFAGPVASKKRGHAGHRPAINPLRIETQTNDVQWWWRGIGGVGRADYF
jgi:hypothetical protein